MRRTSQLLAKQQQTLTREASQKIHSNLSVRKGLAQKDNGNPMNAVVLRLHISVENSEENVQEKISQLLDREKY